MKIRSILAGLAALIASTAPAPTSAQIQMQFTTTDGHVCSATTTVVKLDRATGALNASNVTMAPTCTSAGGGGEFGVTITAPVSAALGSTFNVVWTASSDAQICVYGGLASSGGSFGSVSGWPLGATACSGSTCAGSHTKPVTVNASGAYLFSMTCTNPSGYAEAPLIVH